MNPVSIPKHKQPRGVYDAIVIGLGGVGAFALRSLARGGSMKNKVLGLEQFHIGHELGSSHGGTRLFRHAYFEHPDYVPLCLRSTEIFRDLGRDRNIPLLHPCGVLVVSDGGSSGTYEIFERCSESARIHGIPVRSLDAHDLHEEYGNCFRIPPADDSQKGYRGLLEPGAGFVRPELAVRYAIDDALSQGAEVRLGMAVADISIAEDGKGSDGEVLYAVEMSDGTIYHSRGVVVSVGAWASRLVPELAPYLRVTRQVQAWFELPPPREEEARSDATTTMRLPPVGWYLDRASDTLGIYGIPADPLSEHPARSKIALHGREVPWDPDDFEQGPGDEKRRPGVSKDELNELREAVRDWIPEAAAGIVDAKACLYTMTPDEDFVLDRCDRLAGAPGAVCTGSAGQSPNVWYAAGLSGHGFKMAPALGEALAELVVHGKTDLPVGFLRKDRLFGKSKQSKQAN